MSVVHRITGYDGRGRLTLEHEVPLEQMGAVKVLANVDAQDTEAVGSYPIKPDQVEKIGRILRKQIQAHGYSWFLEPLSGDDR